MRKGFFIALMTIVMVSCSNDELGFEKSRESNISYQYKDENDDIGSVLLNFKAPVIVSDEYATSKGYQMYSLNTDSIDLVIAPQRIR